MILRPEKLVEVYHKCHIGVVFSTTNYSLVPLEMMACNLPVVEIDTESPRAIFKEAEVSFAAPDPGKIADAIEELTRNASLLARQREKARNFVLCLGWENSVRSVETAILDRWANAAFKRLNRSESAPRRSITSHMPRSSSRPSIPDHSSKQCLNG